MILYLEKQAKHYPQTQKILAKFPKAQVIEIDHYKNIFDKNTAGLAEEKSIIIAKLNSPAITEAPDGYGHTKQAYFFKTSLGCIYDCSYCFLKGAFKTEHMVFFVNYDDIKTQIAEKISELRNSWITEEIWFYSSDYSDIQGMDMISGFNTEFIDFFETFENVKMEIRTKSGNIQSLLKLGYTPKNTEVAFSLNPEILIKRYETWTSKLEKRIEAINTLMAQDWLVGIRLLPLLPVRNYQEIYIGFLSDLKQQINIPKVASSFASGLLYTKRDYNVMLKKYPSLDILHYLWLEEDDFYRESRSVRDNFYQMIKTLDERCILCLEN